MSKHASDQLDKAERAVIDRLDGQAGTPDHTTAARLLRGLVAWRHTHTNRDLDDADIRLIEIAHEAETYLESIGELKAEERTGSS